MKTIMTKSDYIDLIRKWYTKTHNEEMPTEMITSLYNELSKEAIKDIYNATTTYRHSPEETRSKMLIYSSICKTCKKLAEEIKQYECAYCKDTKETTITMDGRKYKVHCPYCR